MSHKQLNSLATYVVRKKLLIRINVISKQNKFYNTSKVYSNISLDKVINDRVNINLI
jgi:hypothetical protein